MAGVNSAIVLVVDRLGAGFLGPYGNTWLETTHFNRLAAQSLVCETAWADSPALDAAYQAMWTGRHALEPAPDLDAALAARAARQGRARRCNRFRRSSCGIDPNAI